MKLYDSFFIICVLTAKSFHKYGISHCILKRLQDIENQILLLTTYAQVVILLLTTNAQIVTLLMLNSMIESDIWQRNVLYYMGKKTMVTEM